MQRYYPEIYFPNGLIEFNKNWKSIIESKLQPAIPSKPIEPQQPEKPNFEVALLISPPIVFGIFFYTLFKSFNVLLFLSLIWFASYAFSFLRSSFKFPQKIKTYENELKEYQLLLSQYEDKIELRKIELNKLKELLNVVTWSYRKRLEFTNEIVKPLKKAENYFENIKVGKSEKYFENYLKEIFGHAIKTNHVVEIFSYYKYEDDIELYNDYDFYNENRKLSKKDNAYIPDFIFEHPNSNLVIDIEIDEPYSSQRKPIHTLENTHDEKRNKYFTEKNWIVIRFSEEQIVTNPYSCCQEIATIVFDLTGDSIYLKLLNNYDRIYRHKKWTHSEAIKFAELKIRNKTLKTLITTEKKLFNINGIWTINRRVYEIIEDGLILEKSDSISNPLITDKGVYSKIVTADGRLLLAVQWEKSKTKYIIEQCEPELMIWTDLYTREYIDFYACKSKFSLG